MMNLVKRLKSFFQYDDTEDIVDTEDLVDTKSEDLVKELLEFYNCPISYSFVSPQNASIGPDKQYYDKETVKEWIDTNDGTFVNIVNPGDRTECSDYKCLSDPPLLVNKIYEAIKEDYYDLVTDRHFEIQDNKLIKYNGDDKNVIIPQGVTHIGEGVFSDKNLTEVTFPSSLTHIGVLAFDINELKEVTFPSSLTHIDKYAFMGNKLTKVTFPPDSNLTHIDITAFKNN